MNGEEVKRRLMDAIRHSDRTAANEVIDEWAAVVGYRAAIHDVLEPVMETVGDLWAEEGNMSFAQVYVSAKITEDLLLKAAADRKKETVGVRGRIVIGNIEDDYHSLGRKLLGVFLESSGWEVHDLGNDVTAARFVEEALLVKASIIGVSAMMYSTALNIRKVREEIDGRGLRGKILLAAGGAIFNIRPELAEKVGADATARNALQACEVMESLQQQLEKGSTQGGAG